MTLTFNAQRGPRHPMNFQKGTVSSVIPPTTQLDGLYVHYQQFKQHYLETMSSRAYHFICLLTPVVPTYIAVSLDLISIHR